MKDLADYIANHGYQCSLYDRRNTGESGIGYYLEGGEQCNGEELLLTENELQLRDLAILMKEMGKGKRIILVGNSAGARLSLMAASASEDIITPDSITGVVCMNLTGGRLAAEVLGDYYYRQYENVCERYGMGGITEQEHFRARAEAFPPNVDVLASMDSEKFMSAMRRSALVFDCTKDEHVLGFREEDLARVKTSALCLYT